MANAATNTSIHHYKAEVNGIKLHYLRAGSGEPVVLMHGFPKTSHAWRKVMPALAEHFTVSAPDLRGCGASDKPSCGYDKQTVAEDIHQIVQKLELGTILLLEHDVGMSTAHTYAATYRDQVRKLVLMKAAIPGLGLEESYDADKYPNKLFDVPNELAEALITGKEKMFIDHFMLPQTYDPSGIEERALDIYTRKIAAPGALRGGTKYFRTHKIDAERNREHAKTKLVILVMSMGGAASIGGNLEGQISPLVENLRPVLLEKCGHYQVEEAPDQGIEELLRFFNEAM